MVGLRWPRWLPGLRLVRFSPGALVLAEEVIGGFSALPA